MLDVVDNCSMLYRLQMEGGQIFALPHDEGTAPRAGQELSARPSGSCCLRSHDLGCRLCSRLLAGPRPEGQAATALSSTSQHPSVRRPRLCAQGAHLTCRAQVAPTALGVVEGFQPGVPGGSVISLSLSRAKPVPTLGSGSAERCGGEAWAG